MSRSKIHDRRLRIARSNNTNESIKNNPHIEHAAAEESREVNAAVIAGTYTRSSQRFEPTPHRQHFSPRQQQFLKMIVAPMLTYEEAHQL